MIETFLFIRHVETDLAGRFCGHSDPPVNQRGLRQIEELIETLRTESTGAMPIDAVYTSDLSRSRTTADAIAKAFGLSPITIPDLREINFGEWEGLSWAEIESRDQDYARRWSKVYPHLPAPGGESFAAFQARVLSAVKHLVGMKSHKCAAVVTHAGVMRVVMRSLCGCDEQDAWERTKAYGCVFRYQPNAVEETYTLGGKTL
jgi:broad specificity phosphatase PhoE